MKNINEFIESLVKIKYVEYSGCYGLYPFQMYVETSDKQHQLEALDLGGDVRSCYKVVRQRLQEKAGKIYLALDFPAFMDIKNDFVAIMSIENNQFSLLAIPYNSETGEQFSIKKDGMFLKALAEEMKKHLYLN